MKIKNTSRFLSLLLAMSLLLTSSVAFAQDSDSTPVVDDVEIEAKETIEEADKKIEEARKTLQEAENEKRKAQKKLIKKVVREITRPRIKKNFEDLHEFPKGDPKDQSFYALLQWGHLDTYKASPKLNWDIDITVTNGKISLVGEPILFEDKDQLSDQSDPSQLSGITSTARHWDGMLVRITPHDKDNASVSFKIGQFTKSYTIKELFSIHGIYELKNGRQVAIRSFHKGGHLSASRRNKMFNRKFEVLGKIHEIHNRVKDKITKGEMVRAKANEVFHVLKRLENHEYAEGASSRWAEKLEVIMEELETGTASGFLNKLGAAESDFINECNSSSREDFDEGLTPFEDTPQCAWYTDFVRRLRAAHVVKGMAGTNNFAPGNNISRAELLSIALSSAGVDVDDVSDDEVAEPEDSFTDIGGHWANRGLRYAMQQNLVRGFDDGTFRPNNQVTRAEALGMVYKIFALNAGEVCSGNHFNDLVGHWACAIVEDAKIVGIVNGFDDGTFKPNEPITRAAMAKIVSNVVDYIEATGDYDEL